MVVKDQQLGIKATNRWKWWRIWIFWSHSDCSTYFAKIKYQLFYYHLKIAVPVPLITGHLLVGFILFINAYLILILASKIWSRAKFWIPDQRLADCGRDLICYCLHRMLTHSHVYLWLRQNEPIQCIGTHAFPCKK